MRLLKSTYKGKLYDPSEVKYSDNQKVKYKWIKLLAKEKYNTLVTIQLKMKNKYMFENRMQSFSELQRVQGLFYSVEQNADKLGYHIHLMFNAYKCDRMSLSFA